jgi:tRNASer (uridine44-2'-O)-methyltransferase
MPRNVKKNPRDVTKLSGKPLAETIEPSPVLKTLQEGWVTSPDLIEGDLPFAPEVIQDMTTFLLANPNLNSSHLFRADILYDSLGVLSTPHAKEESHHGSGGTDKDTPKEDHVEPLAARSVPGFELKRAIVRRLIPRNKNLDRPLEQTCHYYEADKLLPTSASTDIFQCEQCESKVESSRQRFLVIYLPHVSSKEEMPWYHPLLRSLAFLYDFTPDASLHSSEEKKGTGVMSVHFLPYEEEPIQNRLERTLLALLSTQIRLARQTRLDEKPEGGNYNPHKDNVIPRHLVQDTYARLKLKYAADLCKNWVEDTEPNKHVFEDLSITAFLIELWRSMYGVVPADERSPDQKEHENYDSKFPGFVDVACGNGVLVYVLLSEGYQGWGFDARRRKTWNIFPSSIQERLKEEIYIPKPFADVCTGSELDIGVKTHTGMFAESTFIISNHADELTVWTPLMAALSNPASPLPFISIPCCSHSLSGARYRYPPPKLNKKGSVDRLEDKEVEQNPQPAAGDLKALRAVKQQERTDTGAVNSMYGSLTAKTMGIAEEIGYEVEKTLLRIPSTRNMGVIGGRRRTTHEWTSRVRSVQASQADKCSDHDTVGAAAAAEQVLERVAAVVQRECAREGGVEVAAKIWAERAKGLHKGQGKGNQPAHR